MSNRTFPEHMAAQTNEQLRSLIVSSEPSSLVHIAAECVLTLRESRIAAIHTYRSTSRSEG